MAYDFQAAVNAAKEVVERQENSGEGGKNYTYPLVYPQAGSTITVRPLFNPASGQIVRLVQRHEKTPCYRSYGIECPICKVMQQVKDMTGQDPFGRTKASRSRGISFAQYISSDNVISKGENKGNLQPGEIILFMYPWSVYQQLNQMIQAIAQTPTGMDQAFGHANTGFFVQLSVTPDFKYTATQNPYMVFSTGQSDEQFIQMLDNMESLMDQVIPSTITEEVDKQVNEYVDAINRQYIAPRVANQGVPTGTAPVNLGQQIYAGSPVNPTGSAPSVSTQEVAPPWMTPPPLPMQTSGTGQAVYTDYTNPAPANLPPAATMSSGQSQKPACFGQHQQGSPQCICCPAEMECMNPGQ